jgi:hypothetical protein
MLLKLTDIVNYTKVEFLSKSGSFVAAVLFGVVVSWITAFNEKGKE